MISRSRLSMAAFLLVCGAGGVRAQELVESVVAVPFVQTNEFALASQPQNSGRFYASGEYLYWWLREGRLPTTLTTSPTASQGRLGQPDTHVIYGNERLETRHENKFIGTRFQLGWWLDPEQTWAIEGGGFFLERDSTYFKRISNGDILLARPYINAATGASESAIIAGPSPVGVLSGGFSGYTRVEVFSQEASVVANLRSDPTGRLDLLAGARFLQMRDRTDFNSASRILPDQSTLLGMSEHYRVHDHFYGGQIGLRGSRQFGRWSIIARGEAALGANHVNLGIYGDSVYHTPQVRIPTASALTVQPSNTGVFNRTELNAVYEAGFIVGFQVTQRIKVFGGYTFLLWDGVVRSGDQVDIVVNPDPAAGGRPWVPFKDDVFWAQGLNVGLEFSW